MSDLLAWVRREPARQVVVVSGAGLSAASGIPTFRGPEGYWTVGQRNYHPQEMATRAAFEAMPRELWRWYLYRRGVCRGAQPNAAHRALVRLERAAPERFALISQNVDGLHRRAGHGDARLFEVHGNLDLMRCAGGCSPRRFPVPEDLGAWPKARPMDDESFSRLRCESCKGPARPHVLWFDEYYEEELYRAESALGAAASAELIVFVGCSGAANMPWNAARVALGRGARLVDIDPGDNPFAEMARRDPRHRWLQAPATEALPALVDALLSADDA